MKVIPFKSTVAAREEILKYTKDAHGRDVALVVTLGGYTTLKTGEVIDKHDDIRFVVSFYPMGIRNPKSFYDFYNVPLSIESSTLQHLVGKTLAYSAEVGVFSVE
jgi:hypothetical protein